MRKQVKKSPEFDFLFTKGFLRLPHELERLSLLMDLNSSEDRLLKKIFALTYGFGRKVANVSILFLAKTCNLSEKTIIRGIMNLEKLNLIDVQRKRRGVKRNYTSNYALNLEGIKSQLSYKPVVPVEGEDVEREELPLLSLLDDSISLSCQAKDYSPFVTFGEGRSKNSYDFCKGLANENIALFVLFKGRQGHATIREAFEFVCWWINAYPNDIDYLRMLEYKKFLRHHYWWTIRNYILDLRGKACALCNSSENIHVHHKTYKNKGNEVNNLNDLTVLCSLCHKKHHDVLVLKQVNFR